MLTVLLAVALAGLLTGCVDNAKGSAPAATPAAQPPAPVHVAAVRRGDVPVMVTAIGAIEPFSRVKLQSQLTGAVDEVLFEEGQWVKKGDVLIRLDARPYEARMNEVRAKLDQDKVQAANSKRTFERYQSLADSGAVPELELDRYRSEYEISSEAVKASEAALASSRLQLEYCTIVSPIDGRTGEVNIKAGNLVKANEGTPFTEIVQTRPVFATFAVAERYFPAIKSGQAVAPLEVSAILDGADEEPERGTLTFIDKEVDRATGTVRLKATFQNEKEMLWPGQFVRVGLQIAARSNVLLVPNEAVQTGQQGPYIFVVTNEGKADLRSVKLIDSVDGESVIEGEVNAGDRVVVDGHLRLVPGGKVQILTDAPASAEGGKAAGG